MNLLKHKSLPLTKIHKKIKDHSEEIESWPHLEKTTE